MISSFFDLLRSELFIFGSPMAIALGVTITTSLVSRVIFQEHLNKKSFSNYKKADYIRMTASFIAGVLANEGLKMAQTALIGPQHKMVAAAVTLCSIAGATLGTLFVVALDGLASTE